VRLSLHGLQRNCAARHNSDSNASQLPRCRQTRIEPALHPTPSTPNNLWHRELWPRIQVAPVLKIGGLTVYLTIFFIIYLWLLKNPGSNVTQMPTTALDHAISFQPIALILYLSLWVYVGLPSLLFGSTKGLVGYGLAGALLCVIGLGCFYLWPTAIARPDINWASYPGFAFLQRIDAAGNACPSMHVASAVFSAIWLDRLLHTMRAKTWLRALSALWCLGIVYSTLATKQHVALDALAGTLLAILVTGIAQPLKNHLGAPAAPQKPALAL
jgi:membrane-associated phospholipid phosphatase